MALGPARYLTTQRRIDGYRRAMSHASQELATRDGHSRSDDDLIVTSVDSVEGGAASRPRHGSRALRLDGEAPARKKGSHARADAPTPPKQPQTHHTLDRPFHIRTGMAAYHRSRSTVIRTLTCSGSAEAAKAAAASVSGKVAVINSSVSTAPASMSDIAVR
jgi:hypothetical protein